MLGHRPRARIARALPHSLIPAARRRRGRARIFPYHRQEFRPCSAPSPRPSSARPTTVTSSRSTRSSARSTRFEPQLEALSDDELAAQTAKFREQLADGKTLDDILPEAFATVREAGKRVLGMRHFDVQMIGGIVLHRGEIAEMRTGEGKTLVATLAVYLNALEGKGVHVVTVNDYLARRDAEWMGQIYTLPRPDRRRDRAQPAPSTSAARPMTRDITYAHQQRVRLRLPARQHEARARARWCTARSTSRSSTRSIRS